MRRQPARDPLGHLHKHQATHQAPSTVCLQGACMCAVPLASARRHTPRGAAAINAHWPRSLRRLHKSGLRLLALTTCARTKVKVRQGGRHAACCCMGGAQPIRRAMLLIYGPSWHAWLVKLPYASLRASSVHRVGEPAAATGPMGERGYAASMQLHSSSGWCVCAVQSGWPRNARVQGAPTHHIAMAC